MTHQEGEELLFVLTGEIELLIGGHKEHLRPGDCLQLESTIAHWVTALGDEPSSVLMVVTATALRRASRTRAGPAKLEC